MKGAALTVAPLPTLADVVGVAPLPTLADVVDETLGDALRLGVARCLWCGEAAVAAAADTAKRELSSSPLYCLLCEGPQ